MEDKQTQTELLGASQQCKIPFCGGNHFSGYCKCYFCESEQHHFSTCPCVNRENGDCTDCVNGVNHRSLYCVNRNSFLKYVNSFPWSEKSCGFCINAFFNKRRDTDFITATSHSTSEHMCSSCGIRGHHSLKDCPLKMAVV